jgi:hypothetical protein
MNWEAVTASATAFTAFVIAVTALVGVTQLAQLRAQRRDTAAVELMRSLQDPDFSRAFALIIALPADVSAKELHAFGPAYVEAAQILALRYEMLGVLVYRGVVSFDVTEDLTSGAVVATWLRLNNNALELRETQNYPMYLEWFQWLVEQFEQRGRLQQTPAHTRHRDWAPARGR